MRFQLTPQCQNDIGIGMSLNYIFKLFLQFIVIGFVKCNDDIVIDLSDECENNLKANFFLTHRMGFSDGLALIFTNFYKNCTVNFYSSRSENSTVQIVVVEAMTGLQNTSFCQENNIIILDEYEVTKLCPKFNQTQSNILYVGLYKYHKTTIKLMANSSVSLKVTATMARKLNDNEECKLDEEITCTVVNTPVCVNIDLLCDRNINCGNYEMFDEDTTKCQSQLYKRHVAIIIPGVALAALICLAILKLCYKLSPKLKTHFYTSTIEDNKLIVAARPDLNLKRSVKTSNSPVVTINYKNDINKFINAGSGDLGYMQDQAMAVSQEYFEDVKKPSKVLKKRLTTNSPIHRNTRVATVLLENIKSYEDYSQAISDNDSYANTSTNRRYVQQQQARRQRNRYSTPDLI